jgi:hypothetical protein
MGRGLGAGRLSFDEPDDEPNGAAIRAAVDALIACLTDSGVA